MCSHSNSLISNKLSMDSFVVGGVLLNIAFYLDSFELLENCKLLNLSLNEFLLYNPSEGTDTLANNVTSN